MTRAIIASASPLAAAATIVNGATIDLPVVIQNTYSSVQFQIGTPTKTYRLMFDTGSASSWIVTDTCSAAGDCPNLSDYARVGYDGNSSSTYEYIGPYSSIPYSGGDSIGGDAVQDQFTTPAGVSPALSWNQTFLANNQSSWRFITADGFLGLAFSSIAMPNTTTLVETLLHQGLLDQPRFGLFYGTNISDTTDRQPDGVLTLGGSKEDTFVDGEVKYAPLRKEDPYLLWRTPLRSIIVDTDKEITSSTISIRRRQTDNTSTPKNTTLTVPGGGRMVFDTGAGRVSLPSDVIGDVYTAIGWNVTKLRNGEETFTCAALNATWGITFMVGDGDPADDVTFDMRGNEFESPHCMPPIDDSGSDGFALVGAAFLRRHYSVFDFGANEPVNFQPRVGFGKLKKEYDFLYQ